MAPKTFFLKAPALLLVIFFSCEQVELLVDLKKNVSFTYLELSESTELQSVLNRFNEHQPNGRINSFLDSIDFSHANMKYDEKTQITYYNFDVFNSTNMLYSKFVLREKNEGEFLGTLVEVQFDLEWKNQYDSFPGWKDFTGKFRYYDHMGNFLGESHLENGSATANSSDGRISDYICNTTVTDWYLCNPGCNQYIGSEVTTECAWESYQEYYCDDQGCTSDDPSGTITLDFDDFNPPNLFQCTLGQVEDLNGNCVEKPCPGNPLLDMEISQWNANKNSNRQGTCNRENCNNVCGGENCKRSHKGLDLRADIGTNIFSTSGGIVFSKGTSSSLGNYIIIKNGKYYHLFAHLRETPDIVDGTIVEIGTNIGVSGESETEGEPHLHYEVKYQSGSESYNSMSFRDPEVFISASFDVNGNLINNCN